MKSEMNPKTNTNRAENIGKITMEKADSSRPVRVNENLANLLAEVDSLLPYGSYAAIAPMVNKTATYVRMFFKGQLPISDRNIKILDAADRYIEKLRRDREIAQEARQELEDKATAKAVAFKNNLKP